MIGSEHNEKHESEILINALRGESEFLRVCSSSRVVRGRLANTNIWHVAKKLFRDDASEQHRRPFLAASLVADYFLSNPLSEIARTLRTPPNARTLALLENK
jgi:hypothetical protein